MSGEILNSNDTLLPVPCKRGTRERDERTPWKNGEDPAETCILRKNISSSHPSSMQINVFGIFQHKSSSIFFIANTKQATTVRVVYVILDLLFPRLSTTQYMWTFEQLIQLKTFHLASRPERWERDAQRSVIKSWVSANNPVSKAIQAKWPPYTLANCVGYC